MPPKKNLREKVIAAELKKKNTIAAEAIIEQLKHESKITTRGSSSSVSEHSNTATLAKAPREKSKTQKAPEKKNSSRNIVNGLKGITQQTDSVQKMAAASTNSKPSSATTTFKAPLINTSSKTVVEATASDAAITTTASKPSVFLKETEKPIAKSDSKRKADHEANEKQVKSIRFHRKRETSQGASLTAKIDNPTKGSVSKNNAVTSAKDGAREYVYEIDCKRVGDRVNVIDLQKYVEKQIKINGVKNNTDGNISIRCQGRKIMVKAKAYLPKRYLRFLCKKFLKANKLWSVQMVSKNTYSYELKYVGTL